ncbi:branched-chain amino acid ABC transporter permease [Bacillus pseudomycoides]|uniref:AzlC family ABC transporter permease n=1 Tax=Bacillus TaxID=1386 RepID=UPI0004ED9F47|nr:MULTISPECIES: AzlC family ABC transporter permease [Bacillus]AIK38878.1 azlC family protein [Bacillus pseudomycoides]AJI16564.1 azlC family protein [Bacillus pseudomycoides]MCX2826630.1 AzlC family ABC transporter permease [Bacillus sp. DHT2]MDR4914475.1 AzlC family ABC transporter permease [Bacillus pseudomycoides]MED4650329.1 AzlC family ABC transporter permease [Bacillus pseudomycoides]
MARAEVQMTMHGNETFQQGVKDCLPTVLGYLSIGIAAGVIEKTAGFSLTEIALMSTLIYAGSSQFILAGMFAAGAPTSAIIFTVFFVNLRHLLMSAALAPYLMKVPFLKNMIIGSQITDETFGLAVQQASKKKYLSERWMLGLNVTAYLNWIIANVIGGIFGEWIPNPHTYGMDYALPAMFIGLFVLQLMSSHPKLVIHLGVAIVAIVIAYSIHFFVPASVAVIIATLTAATIGVVIERWK